MKPSHLNFCLLKVFKSQFQFQNLWLVYSYFLFLPGSVLKGCTFLRIFLFLLECPFCIHIVALVVVYNPLYLCDDSFNFFFVSNFIDLNSILFMFCVTVDFLFYGCYHWLIYWGVTIVLLFPWIHPLITIYCPSLTMISGLILNLFCLV